MPKSPDEPRFGEREGKVTPMIQQGFVKSLDEPNATEWARYLEAQDKVHERRIKWFGVIWPAVLFFAALAAPVVWLWRWAVGAL